MTPPKSGSTQSSPEADGEPTQSTGSALLGVREAARPAAIIILVGLLILLISVFVTARREGAQLGTTLESAKERARAGLRVQQNFDLEVKGIKDAMQRLQAAEALSERRKLWMDGLDRSLDALPTNVRLTSLVVSHAEQTAPARSGGSLVFGGDFGVRPPSSRPPLSVRMTCALAPGQDPNPQVKELKRRFGELPGVTRFAFVDSTVSAGGTGPAAPSLSFELTIELTGRADP